LAQAFAGGLCVKSEFFPRRDSGSRAGARQAVFCLFVNGLGVGSGVQPLGLGLRAVHLNDGEARRQATQERALCT
jgi:hypothetical protein